jgi:hypothetical protein
MMQHSRLIPILLATGFACSAFGQNTPPADTSSPVLEGMKRNAEALRQYTYQMQRTAIVDGEQKNTSLSRVRYVNGERQVVPLEVLRLQRGKGED